MSLPGVRTIGLKEDVWAFSVTPQGVGHEGRWDTVPFRGREAPLEHVRPMYTRPPAEAQPPFSWAGPAPTLGGSDVTGWVRLSYIVRWVSDNPWTESGRTAGCFSSEDPMAESGSPFHRGEREIQSRLGIRDKIKRLGRRMIVDHMTEDDREFF